MDIETGPENWHVIAIQGRCKIRKLKAIVDFTEQFMQCFDKSKEYNKAGKIKEFLFGLVWFFSGNDQT